MSASPHASTVAAMLKGLPPRMREVLERRYGLRGGEPETLEEIGKDFGVTRERVRQIEASGFGHLREGSGHVAAVATREIEKHLRAHGDVRAEHQIVDDFAKAAEPNVLLFLLDFGEPFNRHRETEYRHPVWSLGDERVSEAEAFERAIAARLGELEQELSEAEFWKLVELEARKRRLDLTTRARTSWIGISRSIAQGPRGLWGLREWAEISPRNVGDWAFIALRNAKEPLHFSEIVERINTMRNQVPGARAALPAGRQAHVVAHSQTVHNELIRDERFVLVGRGLYALHEWGYEPGTVRDVVAKILRDAKRPMTRDEIVAKVASVRRVQPNTIVLNLQNKAAFSRTTDGRYTLRRA